MQFNLNLGEAWDAAFAKVSGWIEGLVASLPNLLAAIFILAFFWILSRLLHKLLKRTLRHFSDYETVNRLIASVAAFFLFATGVFIALGVLKLDKTVTSLLAGAGILGLALSLAFQDTAQNFIAGVLISTRRPFRVGDFIRSTDQFGSVLEINLRSTILCTPEGQVVYLPNSKVYSDAIINYSKLGERRVDLEVGVSYGDDLERVRAVATEAISGLPQRERSREVELFYEGFGDSSINFQLRFWLPVTDQRAYLEARSEAVIAIKRAFDRHGITIPFPIRTLDFSEVGGQPLVRELPAALAAAQGN